MGEGYKNCKPGAVPPETVWTEPRLSGPRVMLSWGGGTEWGAPFRRLFDPKTDKTTFARYINTDEAVSEDGNG